MKIKTQDLTGAALDRAVAQSIVMPDYGLRDKDDGYHPSTDWAQGGPIIEREYIDVAYFPGESVWGASTDMRDHDYMQFGLTPLIAAMRCFVASKLGPEVEIPDSLL